MKVASATAAALAMAVPVEAQERQSVTPKNMQAIAPALAGYTDRVPFGDVWVRPELTPRDRSLVTIAALSAGGYSEQLAFHVQYGLENGLTQPEIVNPRPKPMHRCADTCRAEREQDGGRSDGGPLVFPVSIREALLGAGRPCRLDHRQGLV